MTHTKDEALQMCLEYIETDAHERKYVRHAIKQALAAQPAVQEPVELVQIEHWRQDTMESGHWEQTKAMPRHVAERLFHHFDRASIITAAPEKGQP